MRTDGNNDGVAQAADVSKGLPGWVSGRAPTRIADVAASLKYRAGIAYNRVETRLFDLRHGTDTAGKMPVTDLERVVGDNLGRGTGYQAVNEAHFRHVMGTLSFPRGSVFVDIGCGKGKPVLLAATYPFIDHAIGIEFGGALCTIARRNAAHYGQRRSLSAEIAIVHTDALCYEIAADQNIFFINNPFDAELFAAFVDRIAVSAKRWPRPIWVLYGNPAHREVIESHPQFECQAVFRFFGPGRDIAVYRSLI